MKILTVIGSWDSGYGWDLPFTADFVFDGAGLRVDCLRIQSPGGDVSDRVYDCCEQRARDLAWDKLAEEAKL
jgi:hypothetical protein